MDYGKRVHRLLRILTLIQSHRGWTPQSLARELGTTQRTIYRDLDHLKAIGVPIIFDRERGQYHINGHFFMPPVHLSLAEALSLTLLCEHVAKDEQIPFVKPAWQALHKIESQLPATMRDGLATRLRDMAIKTGPAMPPDGYRDVYDTVQEALATRRKLLCKYEPAASERDCDDEFEFAPYALFFGVRAWYAVGKRSDRKELRYLKLNRFSKIQLTDQPYVVPSTFDLEKFLGNAWRMMRGDDVRVELWFDPEFAETIADTRWHRTQEVKWHRDGSCTFTCTVSGLDEIAWWVLSMGPHCGVRKPASLAKRVAELAQQTADLYTSKKQRAKRTAARQPTRKS